MSLQSSIENDPNQVKNRLPTEGEELLLINLIKREEDQVVQLESKVKSLQSEAETYKVAVQESELVFGAASKLFKCVEITFKALNGISSALLELRGRDSSVPTSHIAVSPNPLYREIALDGMALENTRDEYIESVRLIFERAAQRVREAERELEANRSMLYFVTQSLNTAFEHKEMLRDQIGRMRELVGARRRIPEELWIQVFMERVKEDEECFQTSNREGRPPFSALRLTWICRSWRMLITNCPMLWRYIAIPRTFHISPTQWDRLNYSVGRLKSIPAIVYATRYSPDRTSFPLHDILRYCHSFDRLELNVSRRHSMTEHLLDIVRPIIRNLTLIGSHKAGHAATSCPINYHALQNVKSLTCRNVQPLFRPINFQNAPLILTSVSFVQSYIDRRVMLSFLEIATSVTNVTLDLVSPFTIASDPPHSQITLGRISTLSGNPIALSIVFDRHVELPNLRSVTLKMETITDIHEVIRRWSSFILAHQRKRTIDTLGITGGPLLTIHDRGTEFLSFLVELAPSIQTLNLDGTAAIPVLQGLALEKEPLLKFGRLIISNNNSITEEDISAFLNLYYERKNQPLSLRILNCPSIPEHIERRLVAGASHGEVYPTES
jgi:hypothetical protein